VLATRHEHPHRGVQGGYNHEAKRKDPHGQPKPAEARMALPIHAAYSVGRLYS
jgi:hypothetical protein